MAALLAAAAVMLGAFGAHGLKAKLTPDQLQVFETGVKYQFYHALGLFLLGLLLPQHSSNPLLVYAGYAFMVGILLTLTTTVSALEQVVMSVIVTVYVVLTLGLTLIPAVVAPVDHI